MDRKLNVIVALFLAVLVAAGSSAAATNTGKDREGPLGQHVLSEARVMQATSILYAPSESDDPAFRAAVAAITGGTVDYFDAVAATPDLATLQGYDCVYTWTNSAYSDNVLFGDRLADFVDGGGSVVLGVFTSFTGGNYLAGAIMGPGYSPVTGGSNHFSTSSYAGDGTTPIHDGVTAYDSVYRDILTLQGGGLQDGSYLDGEIAHAYRPDFRVIYSNGVGVDGLQGSGDWPLLIANSCGAQGPPQTATVTVEVGPGGGGTVTGGGLYGIGDMATVEAFAATGWVFVHWLVNASEITDNPYTFEVTGDITLTAIFEQQEIEAIPTAGRVGLVLLLALLAGVAVFVLRRM